MCIYGNQIYYQNHCMVYHLKVSALRIRLQGIGTISEHDGLKYETIYGFIYFNMMASKLFVPFLIYLKEFKLLLVGSLYVFIILSFGLFIYLGI